MEEDKISEGDSFKKVIIFKIDQLKNALKFIEKSLETLEKLQNIVLEESDIKEIPQIEFEETSHYPKIIRFE